MAPYKIAAAGFDPVPSMSESSVIGVVSTDPVDVAAVGVPIAPGGALPGGIGADAAALAAAGFTGAIGQTLVLPRVGLSLLVLIGVGDPSVLDANSWRDAAGAFALAVPQHAELALHLPTSGSLVADVAAQSSIEGVLLARYSYDPLKRAPAGTPVTRLVLVTEDIETAEVGARRGKAFASAGRLSRDLASAPPAHLTATRIAEIAVDIGVDRGLDVEVFDKAALIELGCGGLLAINAGSVEEPRMVKLTYRPQGAAGPAPHLTLVGKGIMYDSGGISLKPSDAVHATMKNDMAGAGAVLSAMSALSALDCPTAVTAYLMCTDNLPSGSAVNLGDVYTARGGTTVEVINTDAEGRVVMADALVLATEEPTDAIVDIATLTGACLRALGTQIAGVLGTSQPLIDQVRAAGELADEPVWQLPLVRRYRGELESEVADLRNLGGANAGSITAALFLAEFVGDVPWAHVDIAGTAANDLPNSWRLKGITGFGARLLLELALDFQPPAR